MTIASKERDPLPEDAPDIRIADHRPASAAPAPVRPRRVAGTLLAVLVLAGIGGAIWFWPATTPPNQLRARMEAIPVLVATATKQDVPIWLDALGTVQAFNTVTIKAMVDGPLLEVRFREGQDVRAGDVLARIDPRGFQAALDQAVARKAQDEAQLDNARLDFSRYTKLGQSNFTSAQQVDTARAQVAQLEAQVRQDQAQIDNAGTQLSYTTITAPVDGRTGMRLVDQGNIVHPGDANGLVVITTLQPISVVFTLPQQSLPAVSFAMRQGEVDVLALAQGDAAARVLDTGRLTVLDNQVDPATGTIKLKARFSNRDFLLWPGGFVGIRLRADTRTDATTVPPAAVQRGPRGTFVYVVNTGDRVTRRNVTVGHEDEEVSVITDGVQPGERVVTDGTARLTDGARISVGDPGSARSGGAATAPPGAGRRGGAR
jgi:multidrug efflux system membrane fusion protein